MRRLSPCRHSVSRTNLPMSLTLKKIRQRKRRTQRCAAVHASHNVTGTRRHTEIRRDPMLPHGFACTTTWHFDRARLTQGFQDPGCSIQAKTGQENHVAVPRGNNVFRILAYAYIGAGYNERPRSVGIPPRGRCRVRLGPGLHPLGAQSRETRRSTT